MRRRIYIIPKSKNIEDAIENARLANCPEIVHGIPPALAGVIDEAILPIAYEEPEYPLPPQPVEPPRSSHISVLTAVNATKARPAQIKRVWEGRDYLYDCLATQTVKDEFIAGKMAIGDYVIVHFDDVGEQIVIAKVWKSW